MKQLQLNEQDALKLYPDASAEMKTIFESTFGKRFFSQKITDRVHDWEDICGIIVDQYGMSNTPFSNSRNAIEKSANAFVKLCMIAKVYNEGTILNWENSDQYRYFPYKSLSGGRWVMGVNCWFSFHGYPCGLYFKSKELCEDAMTKFKEIFDDYYM